MEQAEPGKHRYAANQYKQKPDPMAESCRSTEVLLGGAEARVGGKNHSAQS